MRRASATPPGDPTSYTELTSDEEEAVRAEWEFKDAKMAATQHLRDRASIRKTQEELMEILYSQGFDAWKAEEDAVRAVYPDP